MCQAQMRNRQLKKECVHSSTDKSVCLESKARAPINFAGKEHCKEYRKWDRYADEPPLFPVTGFAREDSLLKPRCTGNKNPTK